MTCASCGAPNPLTARFCQRCGAPFGAPCPACGAATWPEARYCTECGAPVPNRAAAPPDVVASTLGAPTALPEERRLVTVLFADVVGFTPLAERLDPEEVRDLMLGAFRELARCVRQLGGRIEKYIGDALLGLFGAPVAREDDALRALQCALKLHETVREVSARLPLPPDAPLQLRIGVNTGLAVVGAVGEGSEYGVMGDTVNTAARLQSAAEPGATLVGEATWRVAQHHFAFAAPRLLALKGKVAPVLGYPLLGERSAGAPAGALEPLVGREVETAALRVWLEAVAAGHGRIAVVIGETGMGKSRLLAEARAHAERLGLGWAHAQGQPSRQHEPGSAFDEAVRALLGLPLPATPVDPATLDARLRARLAELAVPEAYPFLAMRLRLPLAQEALEACRPLSPAAMQAKAAAAIGGLFAALAAERPLVLALDDAHWADPTSLTIQERLLALTERVPLGLLYAFRPDPESACWRLRARAAHELPHRYLELTLGPLSREASAGLAVRLLGAEAAPAVIGLVLERAGGNPLYLEEVARGLLDSGSLVRTASGWHLAEGSEPDLPASLHAAVLARLDRLAEPTRHLLQAASVLGREFALPVLQRLVGPEIALEAALLEAQRAGLLEAVDSGPARRYQFRHGLLQEVSYSTLLLRRRRELHSAAAAALAATAPSPEARPVEAIADHYVRAEAWPEAQAAAAEAATRAERAHAYHEAAAHWRTARRAAEAQGSAVPPRVRAEYAEREGHALAHLGEWAAAEAAYERAVAAWMAEPPRVRQPARSRLHVALARMALYRSDLDRVSATLAVAVPGLRPDQPELSTALSLEAQACLLRGQFHAAAVNAQRALALAERVGGLAERADAYAALAHPALLGELGEQVRVYGDAWVALARELGDPTALVNALLARVATHISLLSVGSAEREADTAEALAIATDLRAPALVRAARAMHGGLLFLRGQWEAAEHELAGGVGTHPEDSGFLADVTRFILGWLHTARGGLAVGRGWFEEGLARTRLSHSPIWMEAGLGRNLRLAGDPVGARAALARAMAALDATGCSACGMVFYGIAAEEYAALGETDEAARTADEAMRLGRLLGRIPAQLAAHRARARVHLDAGAPDQALAALRPALRLAQTIDNPYEQAQTAHLAGRARLARGRRADRPAGRVLLTQALAGFERLGARPEADVCRAALTAVAGRRRPAPPASPARLVRAG